MRKVIALGIVFALTAVIFSAVPISAPGMTTYSNPDATYLAEATAKISIADLVFDSYHGSITDGDQTVTFSSDMRKRGPVPTGWGTWSSPPYSETAYPHVLYSSANSLTLTLSKPTTVFGFELEPNAMGTYSFTVGFYTGTTLIGSITQDVAGFAGARLFAAETQSTAFDNVDISVSGDPLGFAIAQVRYNPYDPVDDVEDIDDYIQDLIDDDFDKNPDQRKNALSNKLAEVIEKIEAGEYQAAINTLQKDILPKMDGEPKPDDWIIDPDAQADLTAMINALIEYLEGLL